MHALLACETLTASLFHFIHRQIVSGYSDPKLLEMLFYTLLTLCNFDALHAASSIPQAPPTWTPSVGGLKSVERVVKRRVLRRMLRETQ